MEPSIRQNSCKFSVDYDKKIIFCIPDEGNDYVVLTTPALYAWHAYNLTTSQGISHWNLLEVAGFAKDDMVLKMLQGFKIVFVSCKEIYVYGFILRENKGDIVFGFSEDSTHEIKGSPFIRRKTVFISHSSADKNSVRQLVSSLEKFINVWIDERAILAGDSITEQIDKGLADADAIILCLSEASKDSGWVRKEYAYGMHVGKKVLPVRLDDCTPPPTLVDLKYVDFFGNEEECIQEIFQSVELSSK
jgi:hypothetical protein